MTATMLVGLAVLATGAAVTPAPTTAEAQSDAFAEADRLFDTQRSNPGVPEKIQGLLDKATSESAETYDVCWRKARLQWWIADGLTNDAQIEAAAQRGIDWAEKARKQNGRGVEGHFWFAANLGLYSKAVGVMRALMSGAEKRFLTALDTATNLDSRYFFAAPLRLKAAYYQNLPWPKRDLAKSVAMLQKALEAAPRGLRSRWLLALAYERMKDIASARRELEAILAARAADVDAGDLPRLQTWARVRLAQFG